MKKQNSVSQSKEIKKIALSVINKALGEIHLVEYTDVIGGILSIEASRDVYQEIENYKKKLAKL